MKNKKEQHVLFFLPVQICTVAHPPILGVSRSTRVEAIAHAEDQCIILQHGRHPMAHHSSRSAANTPIARHDRIHVMAHTPLKKKEHPQPLLCFQHRSLKDASPLDRQHRLLLDTHTHTHTLTCLLRFSSSLAFRSISRASSFSLRALSFENNSAAFRLAFCRNASSFRANTITCEQADFTIEGKIRHRGEGERQGVVKINPETQREGKLTHQTKDTHSPCFISLWVRRGKCSLSYPHYPEKDLRVHQAHKIPSTDTLPKKLEHKNGRRDAHEVPGSFRN